MDYKKFACKKCNNIPTANTFKCINDHIYCSGCAKSTKKCPKCDLRLIQEKQNEAFIKETTKILIKKPCKYVDRGCELTFPSHIEMGLHSIECKFQPYECIGQKLNLWKCNWKNSKHLLDDHLITNHNNEIKVFDFKEVSSVYFNENNIKNINQIRLINAFNKSFIFLYEVDYKQKLIFIIIFLLGRKKDAKKYMYHFSIISSKDSSMKIKFALPCFSDADNIRKHLNDGECVCLPFNIVKGYSDENTKAFSFYFRMSKKDNETTAD